TGPPGTANTSPYEYVTTATIGDCGINRQGCPQGSGMDSYQAGGADCTAASPPQGCYGVPLYREYLTDTEYANYQRDSRNFKWPVIRMMGQDTGQRSTLTVNHGLYYIDDQVKRETQQRSGATNLNVYLPGHTFFQAEDGIRDWSVTGVQTCALPICTRLNSKQRRHTRLVSDWSSDVC